MLPETPELIVVLPVYNEQASIRKVVTEWFQELENWTENFVFLVINDGSTDGTVGMLSRLRERFGTRLEILNQENRGHGQTCLRGYGIAVERGIPFVLQIDSDGQCDSEYFFRFWRMRSNFQVIYGKRIRRDDGWRRVIASLVLKGVVFAACGVWCIDANVPYRLMQTKAIEPALTRIGADFFLCNVALAVLLRRTAGIAHGTVPIRFRERYGGEPSVPLGKFGEKAFELIRQLRGLK
ncbi:MAG TPA: glycosyltransferase family 2 protein [Chthoniobacter sp.]|nr:glycosyltransferase family 2 protein [Chthoniobacter sp.]